MTTDVAIRVQSLSKCYHLYDAPRDRLKQFVVPKLCRAIPALKRFFPTSNSPLPTDQGVPTYRHESAGGGGFCAIELRAEAAGSYDSVLAGGTGKVYA